MKKFLLIMAVLLLAFGLSACEENDNYRDNGDGKKDDTPREMLKLTLEELAMYDGTEGNDAYIAVDGVIYDVTGVSAWTGGEHNGNMAGTDVSTVIENAPHGRSVLDNLEVVGEIVEEQQEMEEEQDPEPIMLTLTELAMYDGKDGMDAYIAVDGVIYDVTGVAAWTGGTHNGNMAGTDVSAVIENAPHGRSVLDGLEVIGEIVEEQQEEEEENNQNSGLLQLTLEELAMYDGKDGMDAYIAVDGVIYDVTGIAAWTGGTHNGNMAGTDVSAVINMAPHGRSVLDNLTVVGEIVD